eukprot:Tbor_TRINITY_DN4888_c0_g1::TRINITY_DN4888_c0_g1_i1::g.1259::m.1259
MSNHLFLAGFTVQRLISIHINQIGSSAGLVRRHGPSGICICEKVNDNNKILISMKLSIASVVCIIFCMYQSSVVSQEYEGTTVPLRALHPIEVRVMLDEARRLKEGKHHYSESAGNVTFPHLLVVDTRDPADFIKESIPGSVFGDIEGNLEAFAMAFPSKFNFHVIFISESGRNRSATAKAFFKLGLHVRGYLHGDGITAWKQSGFPTLASPQGKFIGTNSSYFYRITPFQLAGKLKLAEAHDDGYFIVDAIIDSKVMSPYRTPLEGEVDEHFIVVDGRREGHLRKTFKYGYNLPLGVESFIKLISMVRQMYPIYEHPADGVNDAQDESIENKNKKTNDPDIIVACTDGYHSLVYITALRSIGYMGRLIDVEGGFNMIEKTESLYIFLVKK